MAQKRKTLTKKTRFEVFKRDNFTCQYCGRMAPDVILEIDHISPVNCGEDNSITLGVTLYIYNILQSFLCSLKELDNECTIPKLFIDNYLRFKALQLSISTNHYTDAIKYYNKFFKNIDVLQVKSNCKCLS